MKLSNLTLAIKKVLVNTQDYIDISTYTCGHESQAILALQHEEHCSAFCDEYHFLYVYVKETSEK